MSLSKLVSAHLGSLAMGGALLAGIYVLAGPGRAVIRPAGLPGLINTGNTCFVNCVLQALAACPAFHCWLEEGGAGREPGRSATRALLRLSQLLNNLAGGGAGAGPHHPGPLLAALRSHGWVINLEEQDAHELLHVVMTTLEEELPQRRRGGGRPSHASLLDISQLGGSDGDSSEEEEELLARPPFQRGLSLPPEAVVRPGNLV